MKLTTISKILPFLMIPAFAVGCADSGSDDETTGAESKLEAAISADVGAAVGAIVVNGERLCTAALVKAEAGAQVSIAGNLVSAEGHQVVFGGACVGKLASGDVGAAAFVSQKNGASISTPIVGFDFKSRASAGLAVAILGEKSTATPIEVLATGARANLSAEAAAVLTADKNGLLAEAGFKVSADFDVALKTKCTSFKAGASTTIGANAKFQLNDGAAIVKVGGQFKFAAYLDVKVDGQCIVAETIEKLNDFGDAIATLDAHDNIIAMSYHPGKDAKVMAIYLDKPTKVIRVSSQGHVTAAVQADGDSTCEKFTGLSLIHSCNLEPKNGFPAGWNKITVDLHHDAFPNGSKGQLVVFSSDE